MHGSFMNCHVVMVIMTMIMMMMMMVVVVANVVNGSREVGIGVILDMDSVVGKSSRICILMALEDVYGANQNNFTTIIRPHFRDSRYDNFQAATDAIDLVENTQVIALVGPQQSSQAKFVLDIAYKSKVPIISPATSPSLSSKPNPYFIRIAQSSSTQVEPIAALIKSFDWTEVVFIYENTDFGRGPIPYLFDAMVNIGAQVKYQALLSHYSTDDSILQQLHMLKTMQTRVFVVHMLPSLASRFFKIANEVGMMAQGYVWIITDAVTGLIHYLNPQDLDSMQGVLGVKPYIPPSNHLAKFEKKWKRRFLKEHPELIDNILELDVFGIWSYDFIFTLATVVCEIEYDNTLEIPKEIRSKILPMMQNTRLKGLSGDFHVVNGQLQAPFGYQIVNVVGKGEKHVGFWNRLSKNNLTKLDNFGGIIWPGDTTRVPKGWDNNKKLRVGVRALSSFVEFLQVYRDPETNMVYTNGFCMDVFYAVINALPYDVHYEIIPYQTTDGKSAGSIDNLVYEIVNGMFDMVAGDLSILWNRSNYVDFTLPYLEEGVAVLVPLKIDYRKNTWIFIKPLETKLWITIVIFFICTGLVVWVLEHRVNIEFRDHPHHQVGMILWFSMSTLVFAHRERLMNNLSRFVVIVWVFVVLVLTSSYTASLSSMLTIQKLEPTITNIYELKARGEYIGYPGGSYTRGLLQDMGFLDDKLKMYNSFEEYDKALSDGSGNNGVSAIVDGIPYLKMLQAKYCNKYRIIGPIYKNAGLGFAFRKGSPHVAPFSKAILKVIEGQIMRNISEKWFGKEDDCRDTNGGVQTFDKLTMESFRGLFLIAGFSSLCALVVYIVMFSHENKEILASNDSLYQKIITLIKKFNEDIEGGRNN